MSKCPECGKYKPTKKEILDHIEEVHSENIPEGYTPAMYYYSLYHNGSITGQCRICKRPTPWRDEAGIPAQLCGRPECKDEMRRRAVKNMIKQYGKPHLLDDADHQKKMLANRKISGTYEYSDHKHKFTYTGSYEHAGIQFIDTVMNINPEGIQMPGPVIPYEYKGTKKSWITDIYLEDFNLVIEIKDGGDNKNNHPGFAYNREIEAIKDDVMRNQTEFNYIKLTNKDMLPLIAMLAKIREENLSDITTSGSREPFVVINEDASGTLNFTQQPLYVIIMKDEIDGTVVNAALSFDLNLDNMFTKYQSMILRTSKNDATFKDQSGCVYKYRGDNKLDTGKLKSLLFGEPISIDESKIPDSYHMIKELLAEVGYDVNTDIVNQNTFMNNPDFVEVMDIEDINNWDHLSYQEECIRESAEVIADEQFNVLNEGIGDVIDLFKRTTVVDIVKNKVKSIKSIFNKVEVANGVIEIRGINFTRLMKNLKDLYEERGLYKIFEPQYKLLDQIMFEKKKIRGNKRNIEYIKAHEFFALELFKLFEELYNEYNYSPYGLVASQLLEKTWLHKQVEVQVTKEINVAKLDELEYTLKDYQHEFVMEYPRLKAATALRGYILSFDQGLGKTLTACALSVGLEKDITYIVCPNSLKENWAYEIKQYFKKYSDENLWLEEVYIVDNSKFKYSDKTKFVICNHESIPKIYDYIRKGDSMIIVDESHNFRNLGKRSNDLLKLRELADCEDNLLMSGTFIKATPNEIIPALMMIDPLFTEEVAKVYDKSFNVEGTLASGIVKERFSKIVWRKTKDQVLSLPNKYTQPLKLKTPNSDRYMMNNVREDIITLANKMMTERHADNKQLSQQYCEMVSKYSTANDKLTREYLSYIVKTTNTDIMIDIHELTQKEYDEFLDVYVYPNIKNTTETEKLRSLVTNYINMKRSVMGKAIGQILPKYRAQLFIDLYQYNKNKFITMIKENKAKTIIFSQVLDVVKYIAEDLEKEGIGVVKIVGGMSNRFDEIVRFKEDDSIDVLVATSQTLSTGITLTEADQMFFFGTPWRSADFDQACDRIHRIGQFNDVHIYTVLLDTGKFINISTRMDQILNWSKTMFGSIVDGLIIEGDNTGNTNASSLHEDSTSVDNRLYYISSYDVSNKVLDVDACTMKLPGIGFYRTVDAALMDGFGVQCDETLFVYEPYSYETLSTEQAVAGQTPDIFLNQKVWVTSDVKLKLVGTIKVESPHDPVYSMYNGNQVELYRWDWHWLTNIVNTDSTVMNENACDMNRFRRIEMSPLNIFKYERQCSELKSLKTGDSLKGVIFVDDSDEVVGFVQCDITTGHVTGLYVEPVYRRQGIASELLDMACDEMNVTKIVVNKNSTPVIKLSEKKKYDKVDEDDLNTTLQISSSSINESIVFSQDDLCVNVDKWKPVKNQNILFVTGLSGSGKSTLAKEYRDKYKAELYCTDDFYYNDDQTSLHVLDKFKEMYPETKEYFKNGWDAYDDSYVEYLYKFIELLITTMRSNPHKLYIIEGIHLYLMFHPRDFKKLPLVVKRTSLTLTLLRRMQRDHVDIIGLQYKWSIATSKTLDAWISYLEDTIQRSNVTPLNESIVFSKHDLTLNMDDWHTGKGNNILYLTGLSGSGKTTMARQLAVSHKAEIFELDGFDYNYDYTSVKILDKFKKKYPETTEYFESGWDGCDKDKYFGYFDSYIEFAMNEMSNHPNKLFIMEGIQIYTRIDAKLLRQKPLIVIRASLLLTLLRRYKRSGKFPMNIRMSAIHNRYLDEFLELLEEHDVTGLMPVTESALCDIIDGEPIENMNEMAERFEQIITINDVLNESSGKKEEEIPLTPEEQAEISERFGEPQCSFHHTKKGYYARTHRCRTGYYESISKIPKGKVNFVSSTS